MSHAAAAATADTAPGRKPDLRSLTFALLGTFALRCGSYGAGSIIPIFLGIKSKTDSEVTAGMAAFIAVTFYAAELIGAPIFGALSDRYGRKLFMILGPLFGGVAIQILGFTAIIPVLALVRVLEGLSTASSAPSTLGYISAETANSVKTRGRIMGFYEAATVVGLASGAAIAGQLYDRFGTHAFTMIAGIYLVSLLLFLPVRDRTHTAAVADAHPGVGTLKRVLNRRILRFAPAWLAANAVLGGWLNVGPFLAAGAPDQGQFLMQGASAGNIGIVFVVFGVLFTAGAVTWGYIMPIIGRQATLLWGVAGLGLTSVALWLLNQRPQDDTGLILPLLVGLVAVGVFIEAGFTPAALAYLAEIAEENSQDRGAVMGLYSVLLSVGQLLGTGLAGPFATAWGFHGLIILTGLLTVLAGFTVVLLGYSEAKDQLLNQRAAH